MLAIDSIVERAVWKLNPGEPFSQTRSAEYKQFKGFLRGHLESLGDVNYEEFSDSYHDAIATNLVQVLKKADEGRLVMRRGRKNKMNITLGELQDLQNRPALDAGNPEHRRQLAKRAVLENLMQVPLVEGTISNLQIVESPLAAQIVRHAAAMAQARKDAARISELTGTLVDRSPNTIDAVRRLTEWLEATTVPLTTLYTLREDAPRFGSSSEKQRFHDCLVGAIAAFSTRRYFLGGLWQLPLQHYDFAPRINNEENTLVHQQFIHPITASVLRPGTPLNDVLQQILGDRLLPPTSPKRTAYRLSDTVQTTTLDNARLGNGHQHVTQQANAR